MLSFKKFILNEKNSSLEFTQDNPGGEWLKNKQKRAEENPSLRGIVGSTTGYFNHKAKIPTDKLDYLPGARGEHEFRDNSEKLKNLEKEIGHPSNFNSKKYPIMVGVNHNGNAHVMEGNHRLAYAKKYGISPIHTEVKYYNGGEEYKPKHPDTLPHRSGGFHPSIVKNWNDSFDDND